MKSIRTFKFRCYPTKNQIVKLESILEASRLMYNKLLEIEKLFLEKGESAILGYDLLSYTDHNKDDFINLKDIPSSSRSYIVDRISDALKAYFKKIRKFPRFKSKGQYKSIIFSKSYLNKSFLKKENKIRLPILGYIKTISDRQLPDKKIFTVTIKKNQCNQWFISIVMEIDIEPKIKETNIKVGGDLGISKLLTLSDGTVFENPRFYKKSLDRLKVLSRKHSKKVKGSKNREKSRMKLAKQHLKIENQRKNYLHNISKKLVEKYSFIALEDLNLKKMVEKGKEKFNPFSKSILDSGWGILKYQLEYKSQINTCTIKYVDPRNTSQTCSSCNTLLTNKLQLNQRTFNCENEKCKLSIDRDLNAARNILRLSISGMHKPKESVEVTSKGTYEAENFDRKEKVL
jgi:putative transposase